MKNSLVSIIATCYNHGSYVLRCLESIERQSWANKELIIIDAFSKDNSIDVIENWLENCSINYRFIKQSETFGICKNINTGLKYAKGEFIQVISCDDYLDSSKFEVFLKAYHNAVNRDNVGFIFSGITKVDKLNNTIGKKESIVPVDHSIAYFDQLLRNNFVYAPGALIVKRKLDKVGWYNEQLYFNDWDMWLRLSNDFDVLFIPNVTSAYYRIIKTSMTFNKPIEFYASSFMIFHNLWKKGTNEDLVFYQMKRAVTNWYYFKGRMQGRLSLIFAKYLPTLCFKWFHASIANKIHRD